MADELLIEVLEYSKKNGRICPQPKKWDELWKKLPNKKRVGNSWEPSVPLILGAWHYCSGVEKMMRFEEHIKYASDQKSLEQLYDFLKSLKEEEWYKE